MALLRIVCPACRSHNTVLYLKKTRGGAMRRCMTCGTMFAPHPAQEDVIVTKDDVRTREESVSEEYYLRELKGRSAEARRRLSLLEKYSHRLGIARGDVLEVGSYIGIFLQEAERHHWRAVGVEPVAVAAQWAREHCHVDVRDGVLPDARFPSHTFDVVVLYQVFEHICDAPETLREIYRVLKPGGVVVLETPNAGSRFARVMGKHWRGFIPGHVTLYTPRGCSLLLERTGFHVRVVRRSSGKRISVGLIAQEIKDSWSRVLGAVVQCIVRVLFLDRLVLWMWLPDSMTIIAQKPKA